MKQRITSMQGVAILVNTIVPSAVLQLPGYVIQITKQDGWITILFALLVGLMFTYLIVKICSQSNGKPFMSWMESRFGSAIAFVIGISLCGYYFLTATSVVRQFTTYVLEQLLSATPMLVIASMITLVSIYMAWQGVEAMARIHFIVLAFSFLLMGVSLFLLWGYFDWTNFLPMFETAPMRHLSAATMPIGWLSEISAVLFLLPYFEKPVQGAKAAIWGTITSAAMIALSVLIIIAVFGVKIINALSYPVFAALSMVEVGNFAERIDVFLLTAWMASMFAKVSVFLFCFMQLLDYTFRVKIRSNVLFPYAIAAFICAAAIYTWQRNANFISFSFTTLSLYLILNNYVIHLLIWLGLRLTRRKSMIAAEGAGT
ncbi:endospore germination permease [Paenibacillus sp. LHD-117]|uniref:GerAB/ArcD/ProY family transporter n=1 Tax=Paenibacillus sp. LHD-117 TaxID=3071412 RepID=UPI0027E05F59|nr:endospore germination permease [Paenibacillus sp. LHD-117]MDQ6418653.1 endospore germination permease [Paenibacillus sp. LHD-117]